MEILHFEDLGIRVSFGCERSCSSPQRVSNFNSKVPQGGIYPHINPHITSFGDIIMVPRVGDGDPSFPVHSYLFQKDEAFIWRGVHSREAFNWSNTVHWTETRSTGSEKKLNIMDSIPNNMGTTDSGVGRYVQTQEWAGMSLPEWPWEIPRGHHLPQDCWLYWDPVMTEDHL